MNCYEFELNLSNFIEGELKQKEIIKFKSHEKTCDGCCEKLKQMVVLMSNLGKLPNISAPTNFTQKLHHKLSTIDNKQQNKTWSFLELFDFGFKPKHAIAFSFSILLIISSMFYFSSIEKVPNINMANFKKSENVNPSQIPTIPHQQANSQYATHQDTINNNTKGKSNYNSPPIQVVNSKK